MNRRDLEALMGDALGQMRMALRIRGVIRASDEALVSHPGRPSVDPTWRPTESEAIVVIGTIVDGVGGNVRHVQAKAQ